MTSAAPTARSGSGAPWIPLQQSGRAEITAVINTLAEARHAQADTADMLREHPEINVMLAFNEPTCVGAANAVEELGAADTVFLVGFDSNVVTVDGLQEGTVDALIVQNPYAMGYLGVESAYKLLSGQGSGLDRTVDTSTRIVDRNNMFTMDSQKALFCLRTARKLSKLHNMNRICFYILLCLDNFLPLFR